MKHHPCTEHPWFLDGALVFFLSGILKGIVVRQGIPPDRTCERASATLGDADQEENGKRFRFHASLSS